MLLFRRFLQSKSNLFTSLILTSVPLGLCGTAHAGDEADPEVDPIEVLSILGTQRSQLDLNRREVTGSRLNLRLFEIPASVEVIDKTIMIERGDRDLLEAVRGATGMSGGNPPGAPTVFSTRGFSSSDITILHDGVRIANAGMSTNPGDIWHLERIEVLKGPASVLHGEGAVGGAVNYVSKRPPRDQSQLETLLSFGSWNKTRLGLGLGAPITDRLAYRLDLSQQSSDGFIDRNAHRYQQASGAISYELNPNLFLEISADAIYHDISSYFGTPLREGQFDERFFPRNYNVSDDKTKIASQWLRARLGWHITDRLTLENLSYRYQADRHWRNAETYTYQADSDQIFADVLIEIQHEQELLGNRISLAFDSFNNGWDNRFLIGLDVSENQFRHINNAPYGGSATLDVDQPESWTFADARQHITLPKRRTSQRVLAVFAEDQLQLPMNLSLVLGFRYEQNRIDSEHLNPNTALDGTPLQDLEAPFNKLLSAQSWRTGLVYEFHQNLMGFAQFSKAISFPGSLVTLAQSARDFQLEDSQQFELGIKHQLERSSYTLSAYQITKENLLTRDPSDPSRTVQIGEQSSQGLEATVETRFNDRFRVNANLALVEAKYQRFFLNQGGEPLSLKGNRPPNVASVVANSWLSYRHSDWTAMLGLRHEGKRQANTMNSVQIPAYEQWNASLSKRLGGMDLTLRGRNLSDTRIIQWASWGDMVLVSEPRSYELELYWQI